jgi:hypothetical protein
MTQIISLRPEELKKKEVLNDKFLHDIDMFFSIT